MPLWYQTLCMTVFLVTLLLGETNGIPTITSIAFWSHFAGATACFGLELSATLHPDEEDEDEVKLLKVTPTYTVLVTMACLWALWLLALVIQNASPWVQASMILAHCQLLLTSIDGIQQIVLESAYKPASPDAMSVV